MEKWVAGGPAEAAAIEEVGSGGSGGSGGGGGGVAASVERERGGFCIWPKLPEEARRLLCKSSSQADRR